MKPAIRLPGDLFVLRGNDTGGVTLVDQRSYLEFRFARRFGIERGTAGILSCSLRTNDEIAAAVENLSYLNRNGFLDGRSAVRPPRRGGVSAASISRRVLLSIGGGACVIAVEAPEIIARRLHLYWSIAAEQDAIKRTEVRFVPSDDGGFDLVENGITQAHGLSMAEAFGSIHHVAMRALHQIDDFGPTLHGAAVGLGGKGIIITGPSGSGKSTLSAYLTSAGFDPVADDIVFLSADTTAILSNPAPGRIKGEFPYGLTRAQRLERINERISHLHVNNSQVATSYEAVISLAVKYKPDSPLIVKERSARDFIVSAFADRAFFGYPPKPVSIEGLGKLALSLRKFEVTFGSVAEVGQWLRRQITT